jgi:hypothetical protein
VTTVLTWWSVLFLRNYNTCFWTHLTKKWWIDANYDGSGQQSGPIWPLARLYLPHMFYKNGSSWLVSLSGRTLLHRVSQLHMSFLFSLFLEVDSDHFGRNFPLDAVTGTISRDMFEMFLVWNIKDDKFKHDYKHTHCSYEAVPDLSHMINYTYGTAGQCSPQPSVFQFSGSYLYTSRKAPWIESACRNCCVYSGQQSRRKAHTVHRVYCLCSLG